ncbi:hypothetical protein PENTCL1PPCAC_5455 [Pristionchus entomophagus]|uniref:Saposin B-type domain-containing protein n=1 Tax=Pristionchus entomophagus TaxID=358040 RepID=A0AAV5ST85_9BILA|nr:hypothetical protein PENTCL1PPCAC_5455 [Pristionchus entomophagus]
MHLCFELLLLSLLYITKSQADVCFDCVVIVEYVENLLLNEEDHIEEKFDAKCHEQFSDQWSDAVCESLVKTKLDEIVQGIEDGYIPDQVCDKIGLCNLKDLIKTVQMAPDARPVINLPVA